MLSAGRAGVGSYSCWTVSSRQDPEIDTEHMCLVRVGPSVARSVILSVAALEGSSEWAGITCDKMAFFAVWRATGADGVNLSS